MSSWPEEGLALAESGRWAADGVGQDPVEAVLRYRVGGELPHHPAAADDILEIHGAGWYRDLLTFWPGPRLGGVLVIRRALPAWSR